MPLVVTNAGEVLLVTWALKSTSTPENLTLKLYSNDYTPTSTSAAGDFTEATFGGYSAVTLSRGSWGTAVTNGSNKAQITYTAQVFTTTGGTSTTYGYYVVGATSGTVIWAERFSSSKTLIANADSITVTPLFTGNSE